MDEIKKKPISTSHVLRIQKALHWFYQMLSLSSTKKNAGCTKHNFDKIKYMNKETFLYT